MDPTIPIKKLTELPVAETATSGAKSLITQVDSNGIEKLYRINYNNSYVAPSFQAFSITYDDTNCIATVTFADGTVRYINYTLSSSGKITSMYVNNVPNTTEETT